MSDTTKEILMAVLAKKPIVEELYKIFVLTTHSAVLIKKFLAFLVNYHCCSLNSRKM